MGNVNETISNVNSMLRTLLMFVLVAAAGWGGYFAYDLYNEPKKKLADKQAELDKIVADLDARKQEIASLATQLDEKSREVDHLKVAMHLLKVPTAWRGSRCSTSAKSRKPTAPTTAAATAPTKLVTRVEFVEINERRAADRQATPVRDRG